MRNDWYPRRSGIKLATWRNLAPVRPYLSGDHASEVAELWAGTPLDTRVVDGGPGAASAVKVCFAAWTKGSAALLLAIRALAVAEGVDDSLLAEWATSLPSVTAQSDRAAAGNAPKAWRFVGELDEIAASFAATASPMGSAQQQPSCTTDWPASRTPTASASTL